jgi:hypothetical protein
MSDTTIPIDYLDEQKSFITCQNQHLSFQGVNSLAMADFRFQGGACWNFLSTHFNSCVHSSFMGYFLYNFTFAEATTVC